MVVGKKAASYNLYVRTCAFHSNDFNTLKIGFKSRDKRTCNRFNPLLFFCISISTFIALEWFGAPNFNDAFGAVLFSLVLHVFML